MKIIILAAGQGKRMWPIQEDKCLIPFLGQPLLYHNLKQVKETLPQAEFIIVSTPQSKDKIEAVAKLLSLSYTIVIQSESRGMADAILAVKELIEREVLILNAEDQLEAGIYKSVISQGGDVGFAGFKVDQYFPGGYIKANPSTALRTSRVQGIVEKPGEGNEPSDLVKLVVDYFKDGARLIKYLEKTQSEHDDVYEKALDQMIKDGMDVRFTKYTGAWIPLKYPWQILDVTEYLLSKIEHKISPDATISDKAIIEGKVVIEEGVRVFEGAAIKGPCYIGKNGVIGNNSMVRESNLEEGSVTGFNSDITRSYIGRDSWFHTNYVGDSVIEGDFGMGSGAVLANLRLDDHTIRVGQEKVDSGRHKLGLIAGKGSRVGVNASTMPGARIGANSLVGPGVVLYGDVEENKKVLVKQELQITDHTPALTSYEQFREKIK